MASKTDPESLRKGAKAPAKGAPSGKAGGRVPPANASKTSKGRANRDEEEDDEEEEESRPQGAAMVQVPAWGISMLIHIVVLLGMALVVGESVILEKPTIISSIDEPEEIAEEEEEKLDDAPESTDEPTEEVVVSADEAVVPVEVVSMAQDLEAAPLSVELTEFGSETAPASDMMATIGAVGGKGASGLGGRGNPGAMARGGGGGADTESAVDRALKWFANHQMPDGSWNCDLDKVPSCSGKCSHAGKSPVGGAGGATGLALLPFLGRGYTHTQGPYKQQMEAGVAYLVQLAMKQNGKAYVQGENLYSQGLVGIALSECYAMTQDQRLAAPTQAVLNFIMESQDPQGGGWRYTPRQAGDVSAAGWQIMALKSGNMAYLQVNPLTVKKAVEFLEAMKGDEYGSGYGYSSPGMKNSTSAVGLLCRMYLGWKKDNPGLQEGAARLSKVGPTDDLYYNYYATQIMHHMEGDIWKTWNEKMKKMLLDSQSTKDHETGSWYEPFDKGHGPHQAGRLYVTSLATMILEVYYRHLPIYRNDVVDDEFRE